MPLSVAAALATARQQLAALDQPALESQLLLAAVLQRDRSYLFAFSEAILSPPQQQRFDDWLQRRSAGLPLAYLRGEREFWSLPLKVTSATLIPRPETELLVELALPHISNHPATEVADLGTGSGAIALALASERGKASITAVERSAAALAIARDNAATLGLQRLQFCHGSWFDPLAGRRFDVIVSNPPYIAVRDPHLECGDVAHEPRCALASGEDGLDDIRHLISHARDHLKPGGWLLFEHGYDQRDKILDLLHANGYDSVRDYSDLAGLPRVATARNPIDGIDTDQQHAD